MANENDVVRLKHLQPLVSGIPNDFSIQNGDDAVRFKHLVSLASALAVQGGKPTPILTVGEFTGDSATITYDGNGTVEAVGGSVSGTTLITTQRSGFVYARATDNFSAVITDWQKPVSEFFNEYLDYLAVYLPFDNAPDEDLLQGNWTITGSPTVGLTNAVSGNALQFTATGSCLQRSSTIQLGGKDFTISFHALFSTSSGSYPTAFAIWTSGVRIKLGLEAATSKTAYISGSGLGATVRTPTMEPSQLHHYAIVYRHTLGKLYLFVDGVKVGETTLTADRANYDILVGKENGSSTSCNFVGTIDEFQIFDGVAIWTEDFTPPTAAEYTGFKSIIKFKPKLVITHFINGSAIITYDGDGVLSTSTGTINGNILTAAEGATGTITAAETDNYYATSIDFEVVSIEQYLMAYLPFDNSAIEDLCGNTWTATGSPAVNATNAVSGNAIQFNNNNYIVCNKTFTLGGQDFTIDFYMKANTSTHNYGNVITLFSTTSGSDTAFLRHDSSNTKFYFKIAGTSNTSVSNNIFGTLTHVAIVYEYSKSLCSLYYNGTKVGTISKSMSSTSYKRIDIGGVNGDSEHRLNGSIDEVRIFDGIALWSEDFTPPTADDYAALKATFAS